MLKRERTPPPPELQGLDKSKASRLTPAAEYTPPSSQSDQPVTTPLDTPKEDYRITILREKKITEIEYLLDLLVTNEESFNLIYKIYIFLGSFSLLNPQNERFIKENHLNYLSCIIQMIKFIYILNLDPKDQCVSGFTGKTVYIVNKDFFWTSSRSYKTTHQWWSEIARDFATFDKDELTIINKAITAMSNGACQNLAKEIETLRAIKKIDRCKKYIDIEPIKQTIASLERATKTASSDEDISKFFALERELRVIVKDLSPEQTPLPSDSRYRFSFPPPTT